MRHLTLTILFAAMAFSAHAQFTVKVKKCPFPDGTKMMMMVNMSTLDSAVVNGGKCEFQFKKLPGCYPFVLFNREAKWNRASWGNTGETVVYDMKADKVSGSAEDVIQRELDAAVARLKDGGDSVAEAQTDKVVGSLADKHPRSYAILNYICRNRMFKHDKWPFERYEPLLARLDTASFSGKLWDGGMNHIYHYDLAKQPGQSLTGPVYGNDVYGSPVSLDDARYKGKYVLLYFSAVQCVGNKESVDERIKTYNELKDKGYEEIDILNNDVKSIVRFYAKHEPAGWQTIVDEKGGDSEMMRDLYIGQLPFFVLLSPDRKIVITSAQLNGGFGDFNDIRPYIYKTVNR